jgi:hypothetical protein
LLKKKKEKERLEYSKKMIPDDNAEFKRKLLLFISLRKRCSNCGFIETRVDAE